MITVRNWAIVSIGLSVLLVVGTSGFGTMTADRDLEIGVVDDSLAMLDVDIECESPDTLDVTITNRLDDSVTLDATITANGTTRSIYGLGPGDSESVQFTRFDAGDGVSIDVSGADVSASLTGVVPDHCTGDSNQKAISFVAFCVEGAKGDGQDRCPSSERQLVKFEWNGSAFEPEGGDPRGVEVTATQFKNGDSSEPIEADWRSQEHSIATVIVKAGQDTCEFPVSGDSTDGTVASCDPS